MRPRPFLQAAALVTLAVALAGCRAEAPDAPPTEERQPIEPAHDALRP